MTLLITDIHSSESKLTESMSAGITSNETRRETEESPNPEANFYLSALSVKLLLAPCYLFDRCLENGGHASQ